VELVSFKLSVKGSRSDELGHISISVTRSALHCESENNRTRRYIITWANVNRLIEYFSCKIPE